MSILMRKKHVNFVFFFYKPVSLALFHLNPFLVNVAIRYPLETSENQKLFCVFRREHWLEIGKWRNACAAKVMTYV